MLEIQINLGQLLPGWGNQIRPGRTTNRLPIFPAFRRRKIFASARRRLRPPLLILRHIRPPMRQRSLPGVEDVEVGVPELLRALDNVADLKVRQRDVGVGIRKFANAGI